ncbi:glycoside hydrolase family 3 protein [Yunchengibacter salinarum]|uniref:glycoside hydrolase family 3 protein n=1 Tax=Yunchengibacter salinarum TaxID=3133399 RepID=UPI0035B5D75B
MREMSGMLTCAHKARGLVVGLLAGLVLGGAAVAADPDDGAADGVEQWPVVNSAVRPDPELEARIDALIDRMSVEEKVGQTLQGEIQHVTPEDVRTYHLGSVLNGGGSMPDRNKHATPADWLALADAYYAASMDEEDGGVGIPIMWGTDAVHGHSNVVGATLFPHNVGLGAARDPLLIRRIGAATAREVRATGIDWTFAPTLAVARDVRWGRTYESYGEVPALVRAYGDDMVTGLQGEAGMPDFLGDSRVIATAKHFIADGGTAKGDDQGDTRLGEAALRAIHGAGYISALQAGVQTVMASFSSWNGDKLHGHRYLLTDVLKKRMGFDGFVVGDWNGHGQVPGCTAESCAAALNAGVDMFMAPDSWKSLFHNTVAQVKAGDIPMARLNDAVRRILRVKMRAGLWEKGLPSTRPHAADGSLLGHPDHRALAREAVRKSLVLLKNRGGVLPIDPGLDILVAGNGADDFSRQSGGWTVTWQGTDTTREDFPGGTTILEGLREAVAEASTGGRVRHARDGRFDEAPDVAVVVFGEPPYAEFQGDVETLEFQPGDKRALAVLKRLKAADVPVVSVFLSGRPMWVNPELNASDAFVAAWLPGSEGAGVADVLVADDAGRPRHDFTGKLSFSWPGTPLQAPLNHDAEGYDPLFAYGYGLSYEDGAAGPDTLPVDVPGVRQGRPNDLVLYHGRASGALSVFLESEGQSGMKSGPVFSLPGKSMTISVEDKDVQEDAVRLDWRADTRGRMKISGPARDIARFREGALRFFLKVNEGAVDGVSVGVGGNWLSLAPMQSEMAASDGWRRVSVPMACFGSGADLGTVSDVFTIRGRGPLSLSLARVEISLGQDRAVQGGKGLTLDCS